MSGASPLARLSAFAAATSLTVGVLAGCGQSSTSTTATSWAGRSSYPSAAPAAREIPAPPRPTISSPAPLPVPAPPPAALPTWPTRAQVAGWSCAQIVRAVNGGAARCVQPGSASLRAQAVAGGDHTVGLTDEQQVVYLQRGMTPDDTYVVAMHERGHQELRQRCDTWACGDVILAALHLPRRAWSEGAYFDRGVEIAASTWARCHGADNPRYGYRLSCQDLDRAFATEAAARQRFSRQQDAYNAAWRSYDAALARHRSALATPTPERTP